MSARTKAHSLLREWAYLAEEQRNHYNRLYSIGRQMLHEVHDEALRRQILMDLKGIVAFIRDCQVALEVATLWAESIRLISMDMDVPRLMTIFLSQMPTGWEPAHDQMKAFHMVAGELAHTTKGKRK